MPFKSEKQRRYLWLKQPEIAKRWAKEYPNQKDLPMRVSEKGSEKESAAAILSRILPIKSNSVKIVNNTGETPTTRKEADSKQEYVEIPKTHGPTFAGETGAQAGAKQEQTQPESPKPSACKNTDELTANALFKKLSVVLSPRLMQEIEDEQALQQAREAQRMPKNVGIRPALPVVNNIPPPMGMTQPATQPAPNPGQTQPAQPQQPQQPANGQLAGVGGGASPNANPINSFGGLSSRGDINGNAALGTQNMAGGEKMAAGYESLAWLTSMAASMIMDPEDLDYDERMKSAVTKWAYDWQGRRQTTNIEVAPPAPPTEIPSGWQFFWDPAGSRRKANNTIDEMSKYIDNLKNQERVAAITGIKPATNQHERAVENAVINATPRKMALPSSAQISAAFEQLNRRIAGKNPTVFDGRPADIRVQRPAYLPISPDNKSVTPTSSIQPETAGMMKRYAPNLTSSAPSAPKPVSVPPLRTKGSAARLKFSAAHDYGAALAQTLTKTASSEDLRRALTAALVSAGGGMALGAYPGWKLQQMSAQAGNSEFVNSLAGRLPIAVGGAVTGGLYSYLSERADEKKRHSGTAQPAGV